MNAFESNIITMYGNQGKVWLDDLPRVVNSMAMQYGLSDLSPLSDLSYNYVLSAVCGNKPVILKCSFDIESLRREEVALEVFAEYGAVKVLAKDKRAIILERIVPGYSLKSYFWERD